MTDQPSLAFTPAISPKRWVVTMHDGTGRTVEAAACRLEAGCLLFCEPAGLVVALAAGRWLAVEMVPEGSA